MTKKDQEFVKSVLKKIETLESETNDRVREYDKLRKYIDGEHWGLS